ncbi:MAG: 3,2-trans-enoyl-CoA isomerase [Saprospiraceae bacterium]
MSKSDSSVSQKGIVAVGEVGLRVWDYFARYHSVRKGLFFRFGFIGNKINFMKYLNITKKEGYAIVQMNRAKANALNHDMVEEIRETFRSIASDDNVRGVILTGIPNFFSAGLDLIELYDYDSAKMESFFISFGAMHIEMARFKKPMVAAITGHSPAGGTVLAVAADYRIMADGEKFSIGLNEVAVNIQISDNLIEAYSFWIGKGNAHRYVMEGKLLNAQEALQCGLVNEVCPAEEVLEKAEQKMQHYLKADNEILINTKAKLRKSWLDNLSTDDARELEQASQVWWKPEVRAKMKAYIAYFTNKNK